MTSEGSPSEELTRVESELKQLIAEQNRGKKVLQKYGKLKGQTQKDFAEKFGRNMKVCADRIKVLEKKREELLEEKSKLSNKKKEEKGT